MTFEETKFFVTNNPAIEKARLGSTLVGAMVYFIKV